MNTQEKLSFKTHALLKNLVGKDLINDDNIAIIELVKNAYDAGAQNVNLTFSGFNSDGETTPESHILMADSGCGMSRQDIKDKWLNIAYSGKKHEQPTQGPHFAGNKGVGRFSCDRLGEKLDMFTRNESGEILHLDINWLDFEKEGDQDLTIQKIEVELKVSTNDEVKKRTGVNLSKTGTILWITKLRNTWDGALLIKLKSHLQKFINPNQFFENQKFEIQLTTNHFSSEIDGKIENLIFENLKFRTTYIQSEIDRDGKTITTELHHDGNCVYRLVEDNSKYQKLSNIKIVIYYLSQYKKAYFKRQTGVSSLNFGSIFLFLNGFRIEPYGERGDDWLGVDMRKSQGIARHLGSREVVGRIEVAGNEKAYQPISSREGLKHTPEFISLREDLFLDILRRFEKFVVDALDWDSIPEPERKRIRKHDVLDWESTDEIHIESWDKKRNRIALSILSLISSKNSRVIKFWFNPMLLDGLHEEKTEQVEKLMSSIEAYSDNYFDSGMTGNLKKIRGILAGTQAKLNQKQEELKQQTEVHHKQVSKLEKQRDTYQAATYFLQSSSTFDEKRLMSFHHQIANDAITVSNWIGKAIHLIKKKSSVEDIMQVLQRAVAKNDQIIATAQFATKANFSATNKREFIDVPSFCEQYVMEVSTDFTVDMKLTVSNAVHELFEIKTRQIDLSMLIDNIVRNSLKSKARNVQLDIKMIAKNKVELMFSDDGDGLSDVIEKINDCFKIGVTTTSGSGIGLYHVKEIVENLGGDVDLFNLNGIDQTQKGFAVRVVLSR